MSKTMGIIATALSLTLVLSAGGSAQQWFWGFEYMVSSSAGDTKDFSSEFSWRNFGIEGRNLIEDNFSVGPYFGWNVFAQKTDTLISFAGADVNGTQFHYVNAFPVMATGHYYFGRRRGVRPYLGVGLGTYYVEKRLEIGTVAFQTRDWHLGVMPDVGVIIPVNYNVRAMLNVRYNYGFPAGGNKVTYWTFGIGIGWM